MKIALNSYSTRNEWEQIKKVDGLIKICNDLNITSLEYLDRHFSVKEFGWNVETKDQKTPEPELGDAIAQLKDAGIEVFSLGPHVRILCGPDEIEKTISDAKMWIDICAAHGVGMMRGSITRNAGNLSALWPPPPKDMYDDDAEYKEDMGDYMEMLDLAFERITQVLTPVLTYAYQKGIALCQETHHSYSSNYLFMKKVLEKYPTDNYGLAYDFGNYENDALRYGMLEHCGKRVKYWHAKCYKFDDKGFETTLDYPKAVKINADQGFDGILSIEFEGKYNGVLGAYQTTELLNYSLAQYAGKSYTMKTDFGSINDIMVKYA